MKTRIDPDEVRLLHATGLTNKEIADKIGATQAGVQYWTVKLGLTNNCHKKQDNKPALKCPQCGHKITAEEVRTRLK